MNPGRALVSRCGPGNRASRRGSAGRRSPRTENPREVFKREVSQAVHRLAVNGFPVRVLMQVPKQRTGFCRVGSTMPADLVSQAVFRKEKGGLNSGGQGTEGYE